MKKGKALTEKREGVLPETESDRRQCFAACELPVAEAGCLRILGDTTSKTESPRVARHTDPNTRAIAKRARTRRALTDVAIGLFAEKGIAAVSILEITQNAQVSNGAFYYHFANKSELLDEVRSILTETMLARLHAQVDQIDDPEIRVAFGVQWLMIEAHKNPDLGLIMAEAFESIGSMQIGLVSRLKQDIEAGIAAGVLDIDMRPPLFAMLSHVAAVAIRAGIEGDNLRELAHFSAMQHLRMLGVDRRRAQDLADAAQRLLVFP